MLFDYLLFCSCSFHDFAGDDGQDGHGEPLLYSTVVSFLTNFFRASGEATLGTLKYFAV